MTPLVWDLIVIGGGAAGLWAAGTAAARSLRVLVLEKNRKAGPKILMSGGTRCNITHACDIQGILDAFGKQGRFLKPALHELPPVAVVAELGRWGVETKTEEGGKVFPTSDRAMDVRDALVRRLQAAGAELRCGVAVEDIRPMMPTVASVGEGSQQPAWTVSVSDAQLVARRVLLCSGGLSYPGCGTTGDGYAWAARVGHTIQQTFPALTPLLSPAGWVHELTGITLPDVEVRALAEGQGKIKDPRQSSRGGFLFTHFGCSGPAPMNVSRFVAALDEPHKASLLIDLLPDTSELELTRMFETQSGRKSVSGLLNSMLPRSMAACLSKRAHLLDNVPLAELPRRGRLSLIEDLKRLRIPLSGPRGYAKAEVTRGGVTTQEVNPHTLESRLAAGLYLAGEILDVDGPIGGYNFQAAFATAHLAALQMKNP